jgi:hypothetical protein
LKPQPKLYTYYNMSLTVRLAKAAIVGDIIAKA